MRHPLADLRLAAQDDVRADDGVAAELDLGADVRRRRILEGDTRFHPAAGHLGSELRFHLC